MKMSAEVARGGILTGAAGRRRDDGLLSCGGRLQYGRYEEVNSPIIGFPITGRNQ